MTSENGAGNSVVVYVRVPLSPHWRHVYQDKRVRYEHDNVALVELSGLENVRAHRDTEPAGIDARRVVSALVANGLRLTDIYMASSEKLDKFPVFIVGEFTNAEREPRQTEEQEELFREALDAAFLNFDRRVAETGEIVQHWLTFTKRLRDIEGRFLAVLAAGGWAICPKAVRGNSPCEEFRASA